MSHSTGHTRCCVAGVSLDMISVSCRCQQDTCQTACRAARDDQLRSRMTIAGDDARRLCGRMDRSKEMRRVGGRRVSRHCRRSTWAGTGLHNERAKPLNACRLERSFTTELQRSQSERPSGDTGCALRILHDSSEHKTTQCCRSVLRTIENAARGEEILEQEGRSRSREDDPVTLSGLPIFCSKVFRTALPTAIPAL